MADFISGSTVNATLTAGDIEIGAVELKDASADLRASILPANSAVTNFLGVMPGVYNAIAPTLTDTYAAPLQLDVNGNLKVAMDVSSTNLYTEDELHVHGSVGGLILGVRNDTLATLADTDGDYAALQVDASGALYVQLGGSSGSAIVTDDSAQDATPQMMNVGGEYRAAGTTYTDGDAVIAHFDINGFQLIRDKSYDAGTTANKGFEVNPISEHHNEGTTALTNVLNATPQYIYLDMDGFRNFAFQWVKSGDGDTHIVTVEATLQDDGTAPASITDYEDVTSDWFGVASWTDDDYVMADETVIAKYVRIKFATAGGGNDEDFTVYTKKLY